MIFLSSCCQRSSDLSTGMLPDVCNKRDSRDVKVLKAEWSRDPTFWNFCSRSCLDLKVKILIPAFSFGPVPESQNVGLGLNRMSTFSNLQS